MEQEIEKLINDFDNKIDNIIEIRFLVMYFKNV